MEFLLERLKEKSTWAGLLPIVAAFGVTIPTELGAQITVACSAIASIVLFFVKEEK